MAASQPTQLTPTRLRLPIRIRAEDRDSDKNGLIRFQMVDRQGTGSLPYQVDPDTGDVLLLRPIRKEEIGELSGRKFLVVACDQPSNGSALCSPPVEVIIHLIGFQMDISVSCNAVHIPEVCFLFSYIVSPI